MAENARQRRLVYFRAGDSPVPAGPPGKFGQVRAGPVVAGKVQRLIFMEANTTPMLFDDIDDAALLFTPEQMRKNYAAAQVSKLEQLREAVFMLIPMWPTEDIARHLKLSTRTVRALSASDCQKVAGSKREFTNVLRSTAARWLALARTREHEANFQQLAIGLGIILDKARDLEGLDTGGMGEKEIAKEAEDHAAVAAKLRAWFEAGVNGSPAPAQPTDLPTGNLCSAAKRLS